MQKDATGKNDTHRFRQNHTIKKILLGPHTKIYKRPFTFILQTQQRGLEALGTSLKCFYPYFWQHFCEGAKLTLIGVMTWMDGKCSSAQVPICLPISHYFSLCAKYNPLQLCCGH